MQNRYKALLDNNLSTEQFSRQTLGLLEAELREVALLSLQEWLTLDIVSPDLFNAVANLRFPSWGSWNGLIITLRKVRNKALQQADAATREKIEKSPLTDLLNHLFSNIKNENNASLLKAFYQQSKQSLPRKPSLQSLLSTPIGLRNRISHDNPTDEQFWNDLSQSLRPVIEWLSEEDSNNHQQLDRSTPWFIQKDEQWFTYNGISAKGDAINYVSDTGTPQESSEHIHEVLLILQKIMGKKDLQETDFRKLLSKLAPEESKGVLVGDYLVGKFIAEGAHGAVHKGIQLSTGRSVAIKFLKEGLPPDIKLRFKQEAEFLSRLNHPHIVDVIGYVENQAWSPPRARDYSLSDEKWYQDFSNGSTSGGIKTFIAMEWITGQTLDDYFIEKQAQALTSSAHRNTADLPKLTQWFIDITTALEHVHQSDIIHRDVKPGNLMVNEQGIIKLMDFGIARSYESLDARLTTDLNARLGSPAYMSPEQIKANEANDRVGPASDIYGLMAVFYELYTQKRLYNHDDKTVTIDTITELKTDKDKKERPTAPVEHNKKIPPEINTILSIGLEHEIADRYPDMETLRTDLVHVMRDEPIEYKKPTMLRRAQLGYRRNRGVINVVVMSLLVVAGLTGWYLQNLTVERDKAEVARVEAEKSAAAEKEAKEIAQKSEKKANLSRIKAEHNFGLTLLEKSSKEIKNKNYNYTSLYAKEALLVLRKESREAKKAISNIIQNKVFQLITVFKTDNHYLFDEKSFDFNPVNNFIAYPSSDKSIVIRNISTRSLVSKISTETSSSGLKFSPNGEVLAYSNETGIVFWNVLTRKKEGFIAIKNSPKLIGYSRDGNSLIIAITDADLAWDPLISINIKNKKLHKLIDNVHTPFTYNPGTGKIASATERYDNDISIIDINSAKIYKKIRNVSSEVYIDSISLSPNGKNVASSKGDITKIWRIKSGQILKEIVLSKEHGSSVVAYNNNGRQLATGTFNGIIKLWDANDWDLIQTIYTNGAILGITFSPNDKYLAVIVNDSNNTEVQIWDISNKSISTRLFVGIDDVNSDIGAYDEVVNFTKNGRFLVIKFTDSTSDFNVVYVDIATQKLLKQQKNSKRFSLVDAGKIKNNIYKGSAGDLKIYGTKKDTQPLILDAIKGIKIDYNCDINHLINNDLNNKYLFTLYYSCISNKTGTTFESVIKLWDLEKINSILSYSKINWKQEVESNKFYYLDGLTIKITSSPENHLKWPKYHVEHWLPSAKKGDVNAMYQIALIYDRDNNRYRPKSAQHDDNLEALQWYQKALDAGSKKAKERLVFLKNWMKQNNYNMKVHPPCFLPFCANR